MWWVVHARSDSDVDNESEQSFEMSFKAMPNTPPTTVKANASKELVLATHPLEQRADLHPFLATPSIQGLPGAELGPTSRHKVVSKNSQRSRVKVRTSPVPLLVLCPKLVQSKRRPLHTGRAGRRRAPFRWVEPEVPAHDALAGDAPALGYSQESKLGV